MCPSGSRPFPRGAALTSQDPLLALAQAHGVQRRYHDQTGRAQLAPPETLRACLRALGVACDTPREQRASLQALSRLPDAVIAEPGARIALPQALAGRGYVLTLEDGTISEGVLDGAPSLCPLPLGLHRIALGEDGLTLIVAPASLPPVPRGWGLTLPLYGLRPPIEGGIGTYDDLAGLAQALAPLGVGFVGLNPVHAGFPAATGLTSPYSPTHRRRLSTLHLWSGQAGKGAALIDHEAAEAEAMAALGAQFASAPQAAALAAFRQREGDALEVFATHQALAERHGAFWGDWPRVLQDPASPEVSAFAAAYPDRIAFHAWLQMRADMALTRTAEAAGGMAHGLYLDLAVGTHPQGAETWAEPGLFAQGVSLGAPPDDFSPDGQNWTLAPLSPAGLAQAGYAPFAQMLRQLFRFAGMLRIDHILGFERAFWRPEGLPGTYVTMPKAALLAITRLEAARAGAVVIGEDLGNIPAGLHRDLAASGILGCRLAMFEFGADGAPLAPQDYPAEVLAAFGTHDLPTWEGWKAQTDIAARHSVAGRAGPVANDPHRAAQVAALSAQSGSDALGLHRHLAQSAARLVAVQIEDLLELPEQANLPGTTSGHPNWQRRLPLGTDEIARDLRLLTTARIMSQAGR